MKRCYLTVLACFYFLACYSQTNQVILNNGKWTNNATWGLGHVPQNGEIAIIPADSTLILDNNIQIDTDITLKIYGELNFQVGKLKLTANSIVLLYPGGTITSQLGNPSDKIEIGGVSKYAGNEGTLTGPLMANAGTSGFAPMPIILPVKFIAYNISVKGNGISINWSTAEEANVAYYTVERSEDGFNWQVIGRVESSTKPGIINNYSYTDKSNQTGLIYYRIKQVDKDGHFIYTSVRNIKAGSALQDVKIFSVANNLVVEFSQQITGNVAVRLNSLSGQVIAEQMYYQPEGYIIFKQGSGKGHYILSITNGKEIKIARHVFLN